MKHASPQLAMYKNHLSLSVSLTYHITHSNFGRCQKMNREFRIRPALALKKTWSVATHPLSKHSCVLTGLPLERTLGTSWSLANSSGWGISSVVGRSWGSVTRSADGGGTDAGWVERSLSGATPGRASGRSLMCREFVGLKSQESDPGRHGRGT